MLSMRPRLKEFMGYIKTISKNPMTVWIQHILQKFRLESIYEGLHLGYLCRIRNVDFNKFNSVGEYCRINNSTLNSYSYVAQHSVINNTIIGGYCSIGQNVQVGLSSHKTDYYSTSPFLFKLVDPYFDEGPRKTVIGNNVWIGNNATIIGGIKVGDGAIIGAGSIVLKDVEPYSIVAGIPAVIRKYRYNGEIIDKLLKVDWVNSPPRELHEEFKNIHL